MFNFIYVLIKQLNYTHIYMNI